MTVRYRVDPSYQRHGRVVVAGSPLRLFRLGAAGVTAITAIEAGDDVEPSTLTERLVDAGAVHPVVAPAPPGTVGPSVTIVVPVHDEPATRVDAMRAAADRDGVELVLVDDASAIPVPGATVRLDVNGGPGAARVAGMEHVRTELVAFVDADVVLPDGWLDRLVAHLDDPTVGVVAPRVRSAPGADRLARYERDRSPLDLGAEPARVRAGTRVSYVPAAAIVCRAAAVRAVGGFDPGLRFGEDVDLVWRLDAAGWRGRYEPAVEVTHLPRPDWGAWMRQRIGYGSSAAPLARRHPGALAPVRTNGWSATAWGLVALGHPGPGAAVVVGSSEALTELLDDVPRDVAIGLALRGNLLAGQAFAAAVRRVWWPIVGIAALRSRTARRVLVASLLAGGHPLRVVDDLAYGVGVWRGALRERTIAPLVPGISGWPERRDVRRAER